MEILKFVVLVAIAYFLGNISPSILLGKAIKESGVVSMDGLTEAMQKVVPPKKANLIEINEKAIRLGYDY